LDLFHNLKVISFGGEEMDFLNFFWEPVVIWVFLSSLYAVWGGERRDLAFTSEGNAAVRGWGLSDGSLVYPNEPLNVMATAGNGRREIPLYTTVATAGSAPEKFGEEWRVRLEMEIRSRKYSPQTRGVYIHFNRALCRTLKKTPPELTPHDVTRFLAIMEKNGYSASTMNLAISSFKFFFRNVLKSDGIREQRRPKQDKILPPILSKEEIKKILGTEKNPKHRLLLMLVYSSGLRVSEVVTLKKEHIDLSRKTVFIKGGKGRKDRCTILSDKAALSVKEYCTIHGIKTWLFPGQSSNSHLAIRSAQRIFGKAVHNAGIIKDTSIHSLRHTFATHLLENGTDIRYIQTLLGHTSVRTTERYSRVALKNVLTVKSPLDTIYKTSLIFPYVVKGT
jgi:site-specific recombinase XerD